MGFIQNLLRSLMGAPRPTSSDIGLYYYIKSARSGEVVRVRINPMNDLSEQEDGTYIVRKVVVGKRYDRMEAEFIYDKKRQLTDTNITGGKLVDESAYDEYTGSQEQ
jgi:hypothetical protein